MIAMSLRKMLILSGTLALGYMPQQGWADIATKSCTTTKSDGTQFVPSWGQVEVGEDEWGRYIGQYMYWDNRERLRWLSLNAYSTFEPDAFFDNYERRPYGVSPSGTAYTNLPEPYIDTQFPSYATGKELAVTIGSAMAVSISAGEVYYTWTYMVPGRGTSSEVKLSSQRGRRYPNSCFGTWCSFGCSSLNSFKTVPWYKFTAPGCIQYDYWNGTSSLSPCVD